MDYNRLLDACPLWLLLLATVAVVCLAVEFGYRLGRRRLAHSPEKEGPVGAMVGAMLGLLAFMLAFTFGLAGSRFDERRHTVLDESNAIGTAYLRAGLLPEPQRTELRGLLREYVDVRLEGAQQGSLLEAVARSAELHDQMWSHAAAVAAQDPRSIVNGLFIQSLNQMIDLHSTRVMVGIRSRIPMVIWAALYFVAMLAMTTMGYQQGLTGTRRSVAALAVVVTFSVIMLLIVDLDRPLEGLLRVSQQTLLDLQTSMRTGSP
jgi:hypothetical protein